jgi:Phage tail lysozyme
MTTLAERQNEFCSYFVPFFPMRSCAVFGGNATQENLCQPVTTGAKDHGSDGTLQWRLERLDGPDGLKAWCAAQGVAWDTLEGQARFTMHELQHPQYAALLADLKAGFKSLETLTLNFCDAFERPSAAGRAADARIRYAHDCLAILVRNGAAFPGPISTHPPISSIPVPPIGDSQMPIELGLLLQLVEPLAASFFAGALKGVITHVQQGNVILPPTGPANSSPAGTVVVKPAAGLSATDLATIEAMIGKMITAELGTLQQPKSLGS